MGQRESVCREVGSEGRGLVASGVVPEVRPGDRRAPIKRVIVPIALRYTTHRSLLLLALAIAILFPFGKVAAGRAQDQTPPDEVAAQVVDSVVTVYTYTPSGSFTPGSATRAPSGAGSGWAYSDDGLIVTNAHVVSEADRVTVVTADGTQIPASVLGTDWYQDVAVLQLQPEHEDDLPPAAPLGNSQNLDPGDQVVAIGTPWGQFAETETVGRIDAVSVALNTGAGYSLLNLIRHDAVLKPGNSGGPLVSMDGEIVGMNTAGRDVRIEDTGAGDTVSYAIDGNTVTRVVEQIVDGGSIAYPYLGVTTEMRDTSLVVVDIEEGSPAQVSGLQIDDMVVALDGNVVTQATPFIDYLYQYRPGDVLTLTIERDGEVVDIEVQLGERSESS